MKKKIECMQFILKIFAERVPENGGIYTGCFWDMAEKSGLWERGTYGTPMSEALSILTTLEDKTDENGHYIYSIFKLK